MKSAKLSFNIQDLIGKLLVEQELPTQKQLLKELDEASTNLLAQGLKKAFDQVLRHDLNGARQLLQLLDFLAKQSENPLHQALGLRATGNFHMIGQGQMESAIECYDQAAAIYDAHGHTRDGAGALVGKIAALANLGRFHEAMAVYEWASQILSAHGQWLQLAGTTLNLTIAYSQLGYESRALDMANRAYELYQRAGTAGKPFIPWVENNRAVCLRNLGRFEQSIKASQRAYDLLTELGQSISAAQAQQTMACTYFVLGRYNEALEILHQVRDIFVADGRSHEAMFVELDSCDLLLQLGRFRDVLEKCRQIRTFFVGATKHVELTRAILNEGLAYSGLRHNEKALSSLNEARLLFEKQGNQIWLAIADLAIANVLYSQNMFETCLSTARACADLFRANNLPLRQAHATLLTARAAGALYEHQLAHDLAMDTLQISLRHDIPLLIYQCHHLLGTLAAKAGDCQKAYQAYQHAIEQLERQRGQIMVEYRADFLADKQAVYEDMVQLCLETEQTMLAFEYAEQAKSRALLDLLAYRLDVTLQPRTPHDAPLVKEIMKLRAERDRLYRRWESRRVWQENRDISEDEWSPLQQNIVQQEKKITDKWHTLLVRNADYARDAALWQVRHEDVQPYLPAGTMLVEYFIIHQQLFAFLITRDSIEARPLPVKLTTLKRHWDMLRLNLTTVTKCKTKYIEHLTDSARNGTLLHFYELLIAPLYNALADYKQLIIVPHGFLHYLPFHAFYDGQSYLLERHEISFLPSASVLRYCRQSTPVAQGTATFGYTRNGHSAGRVREAHFVAEIMQGQAFTEEQATLAQLRHSATECQILHLATHGYFHENNPLFSGLILADGYLTTLDIFNLKTPASLVTLSACETGRHQLSGGDELRGLMRAFLHAGAKSLLLSQWAVEDKATELLMNTFYQKLAQEKCSKAAALRHAQLQLIRSENVDRPIYQHPYFWSAFFLVGDAGTLSGQDRELYKKEEA